MKRMVVAIIMSFGLAGCFTDHAGQLYGLRDGSKASIVLQDGPGNKGVARATLPSGERCEGNFNTVPGDVTYSIEEIDRPKERTQSGMLVLTCNAGHVIRCEFSRQVSGSGYGTCRDSTGAEYSLMF